MRANWVAVDFIGAQPVLLRGPSGTRYTFEPGQRGQVDKQDLDALLKTNLIRVTP